MEKKTAGLVVSTNVSGRKGHGIDWHSLGFVSKANANLGSVLFLPVNTRTHTHQDTQNTHKEMDCSPKILVRKFNGFFG